MTSRIAQLVTDLTRYRDAYYNSTPLVSDAVFDSLEDELRRLDPTNAFFKAVGASPAPVSGWQKVKHGQPMGSLNKAQTDAEFEAWYDSVKNPPVLVMHKCDGASLSVRYENGRLVQAVTRGDGILGEDITANVELMQGVLKVLPGQWSGYLRGEVLVKDADFKAHFPGQSNPRNTANGTMKRQSDAEGCKHLSVVFYQVLPDTGPMALKGEEFKFLLQHGLETAFIAACHSAQEVIDIYQRYIAADRKACPYWIDGLVIEVGDQPTRESLGIRNGNPRGALALKFPHEEAKTTLKDIVWQVGKSGRITPVAFFDEVKLGGAQVERASLHNLSIIADLCTAAGESALHYGDIILASKRNDVIPYVEAIIQSSQGDPLTAPTECPACKTALVMDGEYLVCRGEECPAQIKGGILRWIQKIGVLHFGASLVEALIEAKMIEDAADLYTVDPADAADLYMGDRRVGGTADKAFTNLKARMELDLHVLVGSLGIPLVGRSTAKTIVDAGFDTLDKMSRAKVPHVARIPGLGPTKAESFITGFWDQMPLIAKLLCNGIKVRKKVVGTMTGKTMCQTDFRDQAMADAFEAAGGTVKGSVSKGLTWLVAKDPAGSTSKIVKAQQYGVDIIDIPTMQAMLGI